MEKALNILILQESDTDAYLIKTIIERSFSVTIDRVKSSEQFSEATSQIFYDIIIIDHDNLESNSMELISSKNDIAKNIPFIVISNSIYPELQSRYLDKGVTDIILKSNLSTLEYSIRRALSQYEDRRRLTETLEHLQDSLKEKEILVSEIHHRVKNNLAVVSGLLELSKYQKNVGDQERKNYDDNILRIKSIAIVHEILYRENDMTHVNSTFLIDEILSQVTRFHIYPDSEITIKKTLADEILNINQAVPVGLIVTELISNAFKHAFQTKETGEIYLEFSISNNIVHLIIKDDGIGLPKNFDFQSQNTFGMIIMQQLIEQLNADLFISSEPDSGTVFKLEFELSNKKGSSNSIGGYWNSQDPKFIPVGKKYK